MVERRLTAWLRPVLMLVSMAGILSLAACGGGSGAPNNPYAPGPSTPTPVTVLPATGTAYPAVPFPLTISGGVSPYTAVSTNPAIVPVSQNVGGNSIVLLAANVESDTAVTITVRDSIGQTATVPIVVRPAPLLPSSVTITGSPACTGGGQLCSGTSGTASVKVTGPGGGGLANRQVRFDVVQGSYAIQSNNPAQPLVQTLTVVTDQNGDALVGLVVPANVTSQLGVIRATELTSGIQVTGQFTIVQQITGTNIVTTIPNGKTTINGPFKGLCSTGVRVTFYVFGGTPPYRVSTNFPDSASVVGTPVGVQGGSFDVITNGACFIGLTFAIVDANGFTVSAPPTVDNLPGTEDQPTEPQPLSVTPTSYGSVSSPLVCTGRTFPFTITGTSPFSASASTPGTVLNPNPVPASPGTLSVSSVPSGLTTITIGDAGRPQLLRSVSIYCQ